MNIQTVRKAIDITLEHAASSLLLIKLARHARPDGTVEMDQRQIALICGFRKPLVITCLKTLEHTKLISIERRRINNRQGINIITLDFALPETQNANPDKTKG